jgi:nitrogen regulatory protein P-II 2
MNAPLHKHSKTLLVIFAEGVLEKRLVEDARRFGVHGYTVWDVRGASGLDTPEESRHEGAWDSDRTIEMKVVCDAQIADALAQHVLDTYAAHYGVTLYFTDVQVIRPQKF